MSEAYSVEFEHCRELAMPPGSLFEASSRFLDRTKTNQLMALYALRQSVGSIPLSAVDDTVKWAKLKWWSEELSADAALAARHPVVRALHHSGARAHLDSQMLTRLLGDAIMQIDAYPDADRQTLFDRLTAMGETDILMELALDETLNGGSSKEQAEEDQTEGEHAKQESGKPTFGDLIPESLNLASGLYAYVSMLLRDHVHKVHLLPLDILAEFQVTGDQLKSQPPSQSLIEIIRLLASLAQSAYETGFQKASIGSLQKLPQHLKLRWNLELRHLERIVKDPAGQFGNRSTYGISDVWFAWRFCRKNK